MLGSGALGRPRGIGWRGRWEGGSGWRIHVNPWLIHVNVWQKPLQYCKVISHQLIKKNNKNKNKNNAKKSLSIELDKNDNIQHLYLIKYKISLGKVCKEPRLLLMATY